MSPVLALTLDSEIVEVGGRFDGSVRLGAEADRNRAVRVRLLFRAEGEGDEEVHAVDEVSLETASDGSLDARFHLSVSPTSPISYEGALLAIAWEVEATVDVRLRLDRRETRPVLVVPVGGLGLYRGPHPLRHRAD